MSTHHQTGFILAAPVTPPPQLTGATSTTMFCWYDTQTNNNAGISLSNTTNISTAAKIDSATLGQGPTLVGKVVHRLSLYFKRVNNVTGNLYGRIWDASGNILVTLGGADGLPITETSGQSADPITGYSPANVRNTDNTHVMAVGDRIGFEFVPTSVGELLMQITATNTEPCASISTRAVGAGIGTWTTDVTHDLAIKLWRKKTAIELGGGVDPGGGGGGTVDQFLPVQIPAQPSNAIIKYRGGPVWNNANVHLIFSGSNSEHKNSTLLKTKNYRRTYSDIQLSAL